ncbi:hypothetical protein Hanom_Chr10g00942251 [Helianthus anomalus]
MKQRLILETFTLGGTGHLRWVKSGRGFAGSGGAAIDAVGEIGEERGGMVGGGSPMRGEERERREKAAVQSGEWRHQMGVLGEFKRGVDVAHGDWFGVREGTHLLGVHPLHP